MKLFRKLILAGAMCLSLVTPLSVSVSAQLNDPELPRVVDEADLLTDNQENLLTDKIKAVTDKYNCDVVIVTEEGIDGETPRAFAESFYDENGYGADSQYSGVLLLVSMETRDVYMATRGYGITAFTDYGINKILDDMAEYLADKKYNEGFTAFVDMADQFINEAKNNKPYDTNHKYKTQSERTKGLLIGIGISFGAGLVIALIVVLVFKSQLKSVEFQKNASKYEVPGSFNVTHSHERYLYKNVTKTRKESSSSSDGGSSTHSSSSGSTFGGDGRKF